MGRGRITPPSHFYKKNSYKFFEILINSYIFLQIIQNRYKILTWIAHQTCCCHTCREVHKLLKHHTISSTQCAYIASMSAVSFIRPFILEDLLSAIRISAFYSKKTARIIGRLLVALRHQKNKENFTQAISHLISFIESTDSSIIMITMVHTICSFQKCNFYVNRTIQQINSR